MSDAAVMDNTGTCIAANGESLPVRVGLAGAANMRDLGGYPTRAGTRVRCGQLYRSDSPHRLTDDDVAAFERLGVRTIVDLRSHDELDRLGRPPVSGTVRTYLHAPLRRSAAAAEPPDTEGKTPDTEGKTPDTEGKTPDTEGKTPDTELEKIRQLTLDQLYRQFVTHSSDELRTILLLLSDKQAFPALFYCVAGKDRTGIVAAIILGLLDVPDEVIAADYAATADSFDRFLQLAAQDGDLLELTGGHRVDPSFLEAHPETMLSFLGWIRSAFGSVENLVTGLGVAPAVIAALRHNLLTAEQ